MLRKEAISSELLERIISLQKEDLFKDYILAGGTALALQTGYRNSIDIDLFSFEKQYNEVYVNYFRDNYKEVKVDYDVSGILNMIVDNVKTDVCNIRGKLLENPIREQGIVMFGLNDISAMKMSAICGRKRAKDYADIAYLLSNGMNLENMFELYKKKYDEKDIFNVKKALAEFIKVNPYEWETVKVHDRKFYISNVPGIIKNELERYNKKIGMGKNNKKKKNGYDYDI